MHWSSGVPTVKNVKFQAEKGKRKDKGSLKWPTCPPPASHCRARKGTKEKDLRRPTKGDDKSPSAGAAVRCRVPEAASKILKPNGSWGRT